MSKVGISLLSLLALGGLAASVTIYHWSASEDVNVGEVAISTIGALSSEETQLVDTPGSPKGDIIASRHRMEVSPAESIEGWILTLPPNKRQLAERFVASYPDAYRLSSLKEQEWILAHGYPSLEEVVSFDPAKLGACPSHGCSDAKVSALGANESINEMEESLAVFYAGSELPDDYLTPLPTETKIELSHKLADVRGYIAQARDNGSIMFAAHLRARLGKMLGLDAEVRAAKAFLLACGDPRVQNAIPAAVNDAAALMDSLPGGAGVCGFAPGRPPFPQ